MQKTLEEARVGEALRVTGLSGGSAACQRLREMGFCEDARVEKLAHHHLLVCTVCGTRLAVDKQTARGILVSSLPD